MVGVGTLVTDDPQLTCRLNGLEGRSPVRVIVDSRMRASLTSKCAETAREHATWMIVSAGSDSKRRKAFTALGMEVLEVPVGEGNHPNLVDAVELLGARGITRLMVEGGGRLVGALFQVGLIDRVLWYRASSIMGDDGIAAVSAYGVDMLASMRRFKRRAVRFLGEDLLEVYDRDD